MTPIAFWFPDREGASNCLDMIKKQAVFIVMAHTEYDGSEPVRAFLDKAAANEFAAKCEAYTRKAPQEPENTGSKAEHEAIWEKKQRWAKRHPAGKSNASSDSFSVEEIPLTAKEV